LVPLRSPFFLGYRVGAGSHSTRLPARSSDFAGLFVLVRLPRTLPRLVAIRVRAFAVRVTAFVYAWLPFVHSFRFHVYVAVLPCDWVAIFAVCYVLVRVPRLPFTVWFTLITLRLRLLVPFALPGCWLGLGWFLRFLPARYASVYTFGYPRYRLPLPLQLFCPFPFTFRVCCVTLFTRLFVALGCTFFTFCYMRSCRYVYVGFCQFVLPACRYVAVTLILICVAG